jgi:DNA invertase Pin-like site-specific DNA recombinase
MNFLQDTFKNLNKHLEAVVGKGKNVAYVRVSTVEQNEARQREALQTYGIDKWFIEKASGKDTKRPKLQEMLEYIREDDTVYVEEFSRLGRSTADLLSIVQQIEEAGAKFISIKENFDTKTPTGKLQMTMMAAIAEFERAMILERQREGIAIAKREGKYKGRKAVSVPNIKEYYDRYMSRQGTKASIAAELKISRTTLDKLFRQYKETL